MLRENGTMFANGEEVGKLDEPIEEGDCIVELSIAISL